MVANNSAKLDLSVWATGALKVAFCMNQIESALAITLRDKIAWGSALPIADSGTLTHVDLYAPLRVRDFSTRDRELGFRDLLNGAAVVEVCSTADDVWHGTLARP